MKILRNAIASITILLLALGYAGSQYARFAGGAQGASDWAKRMDQPPIVLLCLVLFLGSVALFFIPDREGDGTPP